MKKHIDLYVNKFSINLGKEGKNAIQQFIDIYRSTREIEDQPVLLDSEVFVNEG
jgi:predicted solute-binding protein